MLTLKNATVAAPANDKISGTTNQEVGRFALTAQGGSARVTRLSLGASGASLWGLVDPSSIELRDAMTDIRIAGTVALSGSNIFVNGMTDDIARDTTQNIKIVFTSVNPLDAYYGQTLQLSLNPSDITAVNIG